MPRMARALPKALLKGLAKHRIDLLVHCGDIVDECVIPLFEAVAPFEAVTGNNDSKALEKRFGCKKVLEFGSVRIGLVHGHGAKSGWKTPDHAFHQFSNEDVDAILFGHSHIPYNVRRDGIVLFNPGSPTDKRLNPCYSFGIVRINGSRIDAKLHYYWDKSS